MFLIYSLYHVLAVPTFVSVIVSAQLAIRLACLFFRVEIRRFWKTDERGCLPNLHRSFAGSNRSLPSIKLYFVVCYVLDDFPLNSYSYLM